jgi:protein-S-isoprenylcysteine O-methyltransferase Ste14
LDTNFAKALLMSQAAFSPRRGNDRLFRYSIISKAIVIAFWATPHMSLGHLVFSIATTGYILVGILLEERYLIRYHAAEYGAYRARVPMFSPTGVKHD